LAPAKQNPEIMKTTRKLLATAKKLAAEKISSLVNPSERKVEHAEKKVEEAKEYLREAEKNAKIAHEEWIQFRKDTLEKIHANETNINLFKQKIEKNTEEKVKAEYEELVKDLEQKNHDLKKRIGEYKYEGKEKWNSFKSAVKQSSDEITTAWKDLVKVNLEYLR
jgi:hypothetical protein